MPKIAQNTLATQTC